MKVEIISVGKLKQQFWRDAETEYLKRLTPYMKLSVAEIRAEKLDGTVSDETAMKRESERIDRQIPAEAVVIALDKSGKQLTSEGFSELITQKTQEGKPLTMIIGGSAGLHKNVIARSDAVLSLSKMTLPHELARIFLLEQIYRANSIERGGRYHR